MTCQTASRIDAAGLAPIRRLIGVPPRVTKNPRQHHRMYGIEVIHPGPFPRVPFSLALPPFRRETGLNTYVRRRNESSRWCNGLNGGRGSSQGSHADISRLVLSNLPFKDLEGA